MPVWVVVAILLGGCGGDEAREEGLPEPDCLARLDWSGVTYRSSGDLVKPHVLGKRLGEGHIPGCGEDPGYDVSVVRIRGVSPAVAVGIGGNDWPYAWLAPGYLPESPRHPIHDAIYGSPREPNAEDGYDCRLPRTLRARAASTPSFDVEPLHVEAEDDDLQGFLLREDVDGIVTVDADTVIEGFERDGIPFVRTGDEFSLVLRECMGKPGEPGVAGLRRLVVEELTP